MRVRICTSHDGRAPLSHPVCAFFTRPTPQPSAALLPASTIAIQDLRMPCPALPTRRPSIPPPHILHLFFYSFMPLSSVTHLSSPASCSGVTVVSRHASQFVYTRPASLRIMLAAYCPNNPSGAGKTMAPPLPHAASGAYPAQHRPDG